jgi:hypothetical protein
MTISYDPGDVDLEKVVPFAGPLIFGPEEFKEIRQDFTPPIEQTFDAGFDPNELREHGKWTSGGGDLVSKAQAFATAAHERVGQKRKYTGEPYITHAEAVVAIVKSVPHTPEMLAAAWMHDVVEDTGTTHDEVKAEFGDKVADLVGWLTDISKPSDGNRATRKGIDRDHLAKAPAEAQTVKVADLIHNTESISQHDPKFYEIYKQEKIELLGVLTKADPARGSEEPPKVCHECAVDLCGTRARRTDHEGTDSPRRCAHH